eukprot:COSAG02_NODE_76_length_41115_cov_60.967817_16_plen_268_part_00
MSRCKPLLLLCMFLIPLPCVCFAQTGGWGSLEYGTTVSSNGKPMTAGQVIGGRWRPLQHFFAQSVFADAMATCGKDGLCYVKNDQSTAGPFRIVVTEEPLQQHGADANASTFTTTVSLAAGPGAIGYFELPTEFKMDTKHVYVVSVLTPSGGDSAYEPASSHISLHMAPKDLDIGRGGNVTISTVAASPVGQVIVTNTLDASGAGATALYVTLTTQAQGRFADNCFLLRAGESKHVPFILADAGLPADEQLLLLQTTTRVEHLGMYL